MQYIGGASCSAAEGWEDTRRDTQKVNERRNTTSRKSQHRKAHFSEQHSTACADVEQVAMKPLTTRRSGWRSACQIAPGPLAALRVSAGCTRQSTGNSPASAQRMGLPASPYAERLRVGACISDTASLVQILQPERVSSRHRADINAARTFVCVMHCAPGSLQRRFRAGLATAAAAVAAAPLLPAALRPLC